jgi:HD-like signal output (HDOD) protein
MSGIKDSIKDLLSQVFGRADFADVLEDRWEYSETFEGEVVAGDIPSKRSKAPAAPEVLSPTAEMESTPQPPIDATEPHLDPVEPYLDPAETLPEPGETLPSRKQAQDVGATLPQRDEILESLEDESLQTETLKTPPAPPKQASNSLDTGNLIAQIAFDSPNDLYPGPADGRSALSGQVTSLSPESELGMLLAGSETTAVIRTEETSEVPARKPLLLVKKEDKKNSPPRPLLLKKAGHHDEDPDPSQEIETLKERPRSEPTESRNPDIIDAEEEEPDEHVVSGRSLRSPTLAMSYEEHAPLTSHDFGVLAPPPHEKLAALGRVGLISNLERDLETLASHHEEEIISLLLLALENPRVDLPPFPSAARRLLAGGPDGPNEDDILDVVKSDPGLAGSVIRAANSPFYMAAAPVASLGSAVVRIGLREVRRVALAAAMASTFEVKGFESLIDSAHVHSLTTGISAEALSKTFSVEPGVAFLSGLLHDAGELLTYRLLSLAAGSGTEGETPWSERRRFVHQLAVKYHCYLGAMFIEPWDLPEELQASLVYHHHPYMAGDDHEELASLLHVANATADIALRHSRSEIWQEYITRLKKRRESSPGDQSSSGVDGIDLIKVAEIIDMLPPGFSKARIHAIIRDILLRVAASSIGGHTSDATTVTLY